METAIVAALIVGVLLATAILILMIRHERRRRQNELPGLQSLYRLWELQKVLYQIYGYEIRNTQIGLGAFTELVKSFSDGYVYAPVSRSVLRSRLLVFESILRQVLAAKAAGAAVYPHEIDQKIDAYTQRYPISILAE
jgi:hypothetical protein